MDDAVTGMRSPFQLDVRPIARFLNAELRGHPIYDGLELQWFDDAWHGTGMLAFLSRRDDRRVDYYADPTLVLDRSSYQIGGGTGVWVATEFEAARLEVDARGVVADVRFTDVDGRRIEVSVDDRGRRPRRSSDLLAPVGAGVDAPVSLLLVYLHGFDLVRRSRRPPRILVEGEPVDTGVLPGGFLHRRHLIKAAAPLTAVTLCPARHDEPLPPPGDADHDLVMGGDGAAVAGLAATRGDVSARLVLAPPLPDLVTLPDGEPLRGTWRLDVDGAAVTGGEWRARRRGERVELGLDVTRPWEPPAGRPVLMRIVTRVMPLFRRWPTTYRWTAQVDLTASAGRITSSWQRTTSDRGESYRRATGGRSVRPSEPAPSAPIARPWRPWTLATVVAVAVAAGAASVAGLVVDDLYRGPTVVAEGLRGGDLVTALGVVPALLALGPAAARGSRRALPAVLGLLAYLVYTYAYHVFAAEFNTLLLLHAAVFAGAVAALGLVLRDAGVPTTLDPPRFTRVVAVLLGLVGVSLALMLVTALVRFAAGGDLPTDVLPYPEWRVHLGYALDLTMTIPALLVAAIGLWRRIAWGLLYGSAVTLWLATYQLNYLASHLMLVRADVTGVSLGDPRPYAMVAVFVVAASALFRPTASHRSLGP